MSRYFAFTVNVFTEGGTQTPEYITPANVADFLSHFDATWPNGHLTWNLDNLALSHADYAWLRTLIAARSDDLVAYWRTFGFPGGGVTVAAEQAVYDQYLPYLTAMGRPLAVNAWHMPAGLAEWLRTTHGITAATAQVWEQSAVDGYSGPGSPNCPFYPSVNNLLVPAQGEADRIDMVVLDAFSVDLWAADAGERRTLDVIDAGSLARSQQVARSYLDAEFSPGPMQWINTGFTVDWLYQPGMSAKLADYKSLMTWLAATYPDLNVVTTVELGDAFRALHSANTWAVAHAQDDPAGSDATIYWLHTAKFRVAVKRTGSTLALLDLVRYSDDLAEPAAPAIDWTVPGRWSQTGDPALGNPYMVASYREVGPLLRSFPELHQFAR